LGKEPNVTTLINRRQHDNTATAEDNLPLPRLPLHPRSNKRRTTFKQTFNLLMFLSLSLIARFVIQRCFCRDFFFFRAAKRVVLASLGFSRRQMWFWRRQRKKKTRKEEKTNDKEFCESSVLLWRFG
jgi:hypothetical protein